MNVQYRAVYRAEGFNHKTLLGHCDELMQTLLDYEERDPTVRDGAVSLDLGNSIVEIEVMASGVDYQHAAKLAAHRVQRIVNEVTGWAPIEMTESHAEPVSV